ncbi:MAG: transporter substrate-binding domain-containing protein [Candidatus Delongbacteria bacterium]|nr:transporter substrate-binding domain-containing protein [Candidatus Delongbacteria bacterium]MBN2836198.1 transporter substrate-binding domain-containing protein [Candidatus Delongbacteria bacterium]
MKNSFLINLLLMLFFCFCYSREAVELNLVTLQYPPYQFEEDGVVKGVVIDLLKETFKRMDQPYKITVLPWARAIKYIEYGEVDGIFTIYKTREREAFADYSTEVLMPQVISLFVRSDSNIEFYGDLSKLSRYKIGVVRSVSYGIYFDKAIKDGTFRSIKEVAVGEENFKGLDTGLIDIVVSNKFGGVDIINELKLNNNIKMLSFDLDSVSSYIAFSKEKNLTKTRDKFDLVLKKMKADGSYSRIIENYFKKVK